MILAHQRVLWVFLYLHFIKLPLKSLLTLILNFYFNNLCFNIG